MTNWIEKTNFSELQAKRMGNSFTSHSSFYVNLMRVLLPNHRTFFFKQPFLFMGKGLESTFNNIQMTSIRGKSKYQHSKSTYGIQIRGRVNIDT